MKILVAGGGTGGHLMPALALADALREARPDLEPVLVGAKRGVEARILPSRPYRHHLLSLEPIYRGAWWKNARWPLVFWRVMGECRDVLGRESPAVVVGTGGYVAGPVLFAAHRAGIPIVTQEQNAYPGVTTRWLARWARQIHLGFPEAERHLMVGRNGRVFNYGNPITPPPADPGYRARARDELGIPADARVLLVTGGSQGARAINEAVAGALAERLLDNVWLLWSTGALSFDDYRRLDLPPRRQIKPFWDPIAPAYAAADLVVSRSGAMTTAELCAWGLPSILVPFPHAAAGHQEKNAEALEQAGAAVQVPEAGLTPAVLGKTVNDILLDSGRLKGMAAAALKRGQPDAAQKIAAEILTLVK